MDARPHKLMQRDLPAAIRARDRVRVRALRTALAAVANAEAVDVAAVPCGPTEPDCVELPRRYLSETDVRLVLAEVATELRRDAGEMGTLGQVELAADLLAQAEIVESYLR